jgi:2-amino-4-hydroxy-6-hydroxymethyldihydropteridine diphosphokinase
MTKQHLAYLVLGGNEGDTVSVLKKARTMIIEAVGRISETSSLYQTQPWGKPDQADFINQALVVKTFLSPLDLLKAVLKIETALGRTRTGENNGPRIIDIDIALYDDFIVQEDNLTIPHPHLHERNFMLLPLMEVAGEAVHPLLYKTVEELYFNSPDELEVIMLDNE